MISMLCVTFFDGSYNTRKIFKQLSIVLRQCSSLGNELLYFLQLFYPHCALNVVHVILKSEVNNLIKPTPFFAVAVECIFIYTKIRIAFQFPFKFFAVSDDHATFCSSDSFGRSEEHTSELQS